MNVERHGGLPVALLDQAFDQVQIGLGLISLDSVVLRVNPAGAALLGRAADDLVGSSLASIVHPDDLRAALRELALLETQGSAGPIVVRLDNPVTGWRWIRAHATLLPADPPVGFVVFEDVTEELAVAAALREAEERSARRYGQQLDVAALGRLALTGAAPDEVAQRATELVKERLGALQAAVLVDDGHADGLLQMAGAGAFEEMTGVYRRPRDVTWYAMVEAREPLFFSDLLGEGVDLSPDEREVAEAAGLRSVVLCPIVPAKAPPGALVASSEQPAAFTREDAGFLESMAHVIAASFDTALAVGELRRQALHDSLTGLPNRSLVLEHLELALHRAKRQGHGLAVVMCDVDRFKAINDGFGHEAGDEVLRVVGKRIASHLRPGDLVGRFGGDELVVVLTELTDPAQAAAVAARLVEAVREPIGVGNQVIFATVSVGVAGAAAERIESSADLLRRADAAMYEAKTAGRDRAVVAD